MFPQLNATKINVSLAESDTKKMAMAMAKENDLTLGRKFTCTEMYIEALRKRACFESETMYG